MEKVNKICFKPKDGKGDWVPLEQYKAGDYVIYRGGDLRCQPKHITLKCKFAEPGWLIYYRLTGQYGCRRNMKKVKAYLRREQITRRRTMRKFQEKTKRQ